MVISMMPKTIRHSTGMTSTKTRAARKSMVKAINVAPNTTKGDRSSRRRVRFTPLCAWLISEVIRVTMVEVPS